MAYICKTAKTAAIDIYRREKHEIPIGSGDDVRRFAEDEYNLVCDDIEKLHLSEEIKEVLLILSPLDRKIFIRHRGYKFTYKEIGEELGMSRDAVRKRGERAEKMLQNAKREE